MEKSRAMILKDRVQASTIPDDAAVLLNEIQVAKIINASVSKLRQDRAKGTGIPFRKIGASVRYSRADVDRYLDASVRFSTTETN